MYQVRGFHFCDKAGDAQHNGFANPTYSRYFI